MTPDLGKPEPAVIKDGVDVPTFPWRCEKGQFHLVATRWMPRAFHIGVEPTSHVHLFRKAASFRAATEALKALEPSVIFAQTNVSVPQTTRRIGLLWKRRQPFRQLLSRGRFLTWLHQFRSGAVPFVLTAHLLSK